MHIRLGLQLDGQHGWHIKNSLGEITVGTNGMLNILEAQLGLIAEAVPQSQRVVQYLDCLKKCDHAKRFYHQSLKADELGTAATLLGWRDQWYLCGWNGVVGLARTHRLNDMMEVEYLAKSKVAPSERERIALILEVMQRRTPNISKVILTTALSAFPKCWQQLLMQLPTEIAPIEDVSHGGLFLHTLQNKLRRAQLGELFPDEEKLPFESDGSVVVVRGETRLIASRWLANHLAQGIEDGVLLASDGSALLDDVLVAEGQARHGLGGSSAYRPALQLLPMALAMLWAPLDYNVLISFLSHPVSPVSSFARRRLAGKLAEQPGIGGKKWDDTLAAIDKHYGIEAAQVREQIKTWIDHPRFDQSEGVSIHVVLDRTQQLAHYFRIRLNDEDLAKRASWNAGFSQTTAFIRALEELQQSGATLIRPRQLQKLLAQATSRGSANPKLVAEVGSLSVVDNPTALIETFDQVIWWQPIMPRTPKSYPWSQAECEILAVAGVELPNISQTLESMAVDWLKPILAAKKQLIIVLPPQDAEVHPTWQMLEALIADMPVQALEQVLKSDSVDMQSELFTHTPLPRAKRWWQLPENTPIPKRAHDSFSSLELYLFNPYQWLLRYPLGLKSSNILSVSDGFLLDGKLAHDIVERFFGLPNALDMQEAEINSWFDHTFPHVVETVGAILLMTGRRSDYEGLRYRLRRALTTLIAQLKAAHVNDVKSEMEFKGTYPGGSILGYADLVLTNKQGQSAIVDMKWGGSKKYAKKLADNTHLQLGIYAEMFRQKSGVWPEVGYYILAEAKLFTQHDHYFPEGSKVNKKTEESTPHLWERFKESYAWRNNLLLQGKVEVVLDEIEVTDESISPEGGLEAETLNQTYNDYRTLAGWRQE